MKVDPLNPKWANRDRLFLSKGHCCTSLYACLALKGFFPIEELDQYGEDGTRLLAHASHHVPGVEFSTGSLGHALPFAAGTALAAKRQSMSWHVFTILSDGELDEGSNWEAILFAGHHKLKNLTVIVDNNTGLYSIFIAKDDNSETFSSIFNSFIINWVGSKGSFGSISSFGSTRTDTKLLLFLLTFNSFSSFS